MSDLYRFPKGPHLRSVKAAPSGQSAVPQNDNTGRCIRCNNDVIVEASHYTCDSCGLSHAAEQPPQFRVVLI